MTQTVSDETCFAMTESLGQLCDDVLVSAAKSGDDSAFAALCERHSKKIVGRTYRITRNWQDAEDALQDSLLKAYIHLKTFEGRCSFSSWLTAIAINSALMILRKKRVLEIPIDTIDDEEKTWRALELQDHAENSESRYARREREEMLSRAVLRLPPIFRDVVQLRTVQECSTNEIAETLGISVAATKSRLARAKASLRALMPAGI